MYSTTVLQYYSTTVLLLYTTIQLSILPLSQFISFDTVCIRRGWTGRLVGLRYIPGLRYISGNLVCRQGTPGNLVVSLGVPVGHDWGQG